MNKTITKADYKAVSKLLSLMDKDDLTLTEAEVVSADGQTVTTGQVSFLKQNGLAASLAEYGEDCITLQINAGPAIVVLADLSDLLNLNPSYNALYSLLSFSSVELYARAFAADSSNAILTITGMAVLTTDLPKDFLGIVDLPLTDLALSTSIKHKNASSEKEIGVFIIAKLTIDGQPVQVALNLPGATQALWRLKLLAPGLGFSLTNLLKLLMGSKGFEELPDQVKRIPSFDLAYLEIHFDPNKKQLNNISFGLQSGGEWNLIAGSGGRPVLALKDIGLAFNIYRAETERFTYSGEINATTYIGDFEIAATLPLPVTGSLSLYAQTRNPLHDLGVFSELLAETGFSDFLANSDFKDNFTLHINNLGLELNLGQRSAGRPTLTYFVVDGEAELALVIARTPLELVLQLLIEHSGTDKLQVVIDAQATLVIAEIPITLIGQYDRNEKGLLLKGNTATGHAIAVGKLLAGLATKFGLELAAASITGLTLNDLAVSFNTHTKDFSCAFETKFPEDGQEFDLLLAIELKRQKDETYAKHLSGELVIGQSQFKIKSDFSSQNQKIEAAWSAQGQNRLGINDLVRSLRLDVPVIPAELDLALKSAELKYELTEKQKRLVLEAESDNYGKAIFVAFKGSAEKWVYFFSVKLDKTFYLTTDLPLIREVVSAEHQVTLTVEQFLIASAAISQDQAAALNPAITSGYPQLPKEGLAAGGVSLSLCCTAGGEAKPVILNLTGAAKKPKQIQAPPSSAIEGESLLLAEPPPAPANAEGIKWLTLQKTLGPVSFQKIGFQYSNGRIGVLLDAALMTGGLTLNLLGLGGYVSLANWKLEPTLHGLDIGYTRGPLNISGGLVGTFEPLNFDGQLVLGLPALSLSALGSYTKVKDQSGNELASFFLFARLAKTLGGPPFFVVTGLCAGFGYNRSLRLPEQDEVASFPLLAGIDDPGKVGGENPTPAQALAALKDWVTPTVGTNWFAAGVQFTSFELIKSNVVLAVLPGEDLQIALLGVSRMRLPQTGRPFVYAELELKVVLRPNAGFFGATAILSKNSYLLAPDCHLTGGVAFYLWFSGEHAGDFVITLGGYHPAFKKPAWYPDVPRLGFTWQVSNYLTIQGQAYFALTPSCAMGGGRLEINFHAGNLRAWFIAQADFLFQWKPFYFQGSVNVSIGISYTLNLWFTSVTLKVELGAQLEIYGPPTGGKVLVDWKIISFTIAFGADRVQANSLLSWEEFSTLLPQNDPPATKRLRAPAAVAGPEPLKNVIKVNIGAGLIKLAEDEQTWLVRADALVFSIETAFPLTETPLDLEALPANYYVAVRPMNIPSVKSTMTIKVMGPGGDQDLAKGWHKAKTIRNVPAALWDKPLPAGQPPEPSAKLLANRLVGVEKFSPQPTQLSGPPAFPVQRLDYAQTRVDLPLTPNESGLSRQFEADPTPIKTLKNSLTDPTTVAKRAAVAAALAALAYPIEINGPTDNLAQAANQIYLHAPLLGAPWKYA